MAAGYPPLPFPPVYQGPSGEVGQILLDGIVMTILLRHGSSDDEADWKVYIDPDPAVWQALGPHLRSNGTEVRNDKLGVFYSELMVIDRHRDDQVFDSADLTLPFRLSLPGSVHPAWDLGLFAGDNQGTNHDFSGGSQLVSDGGRAYLQGAFVNDKFHGTRVEIHPLDSIAYSMDESGKTLSAKKGQAGWPDDFVKWRVAVFTNSNLHRGITGEDYLKRERTTTWFLDLPGNAGPHATVKVDEQPQQLWDGEAEAFYESRGVSSFPEGELAIDPRDGERKLRVNATMEVPDNKGGIVVRDYGIRAREIGLAP